MTAEETAPADALTAGTALDVVARALTHEPIDAHQVTAGAPTAGAERLGEIAGTEVGVWEHTPGVSTDVEADEVFIVLAGSGTVAFDDPALSPIELAPGILVRLAAGMRTTWTIRETVRKVYLTP